MENLGPIAVTFAYADTFKELLERLPDMAHCVPEEQADFDRIILIVPNALRARLGWPDGAAPQVAIFKHDLVFRPPV